MWSSVGDDDSLIKMLIRLVSTFKGIVQSPPSNDSKVLPLIVPCVMQYSFTMLISVNNINHCTIIERVHMYPDVTVTFFIFKE